MPVYRQGRSIIETLRDPESLSTVHLALENRMQDMESKLEDELNAREEEFTTDDARCLRHSLKFKRMAAARQIRLPAPLDLSYLSAGRASGTVWTVAVDDLDGTTGITSSEMQQNLRENSGVQLIVVKKRVAKEAAYLQYPSIANSQLPLIEWAKIVAESNIHTVAHLAVLVDASYSQSMFDKLSEPQKPSLRDLAAMLNVAITTNAPDKREKCMSMRLNICLCERQPQRAKVLARRVCVAAGQSMLLSLQVDQLDR